MIVYVNMEAAIALIKVISITNIIKAVYESFLVIMTIVFCKINCE